MITDVDIDAIEQQALAALHAKLGVRSRNLGQAMKRAGRRLPKSAHRAAQAIETAKLHRNHPKLSRLLDRDAIATASQTLHVQLDQIDPKERRKTALLSMLGTQAFNVLAVIALVVGLMAWRGLL